MSEVISILNQLRCESSTNGKIGILKSNKNNSILQSILRWAYTPTHNFFLSNIDPFLSFGSRSINSESDYKILNNLLQDLSNRRLTGNAAREQTNKILSEFDQDSQEVFKNILKRDLRCGVAISLINKAFSNDFISKFKVQLANKYKKDKKYSANYFWATPKLDGIRAFWTKADPDTLWSRNGKAFVGLDHIIDNLKQISRENPEITFFDGELFDSTLGFSRIQSSVVSSVNYDPELKKRIAMWVFAVGCDEFKDTREMQQTIEFFDLRYNALRNVNFVVAKMIDNDPEKIKSAAEEYVKYGFEGIMLRDPNVYYEFKRSDALMKFKFFDEADLEVIDLIEGTGKYEGMLGAIMCKGIIDDKRITTEVGTGFSDEQRKEFWNKRKELVGKIVEIKYQEISNDSSGEYSLRFPVFLRFKLDR